MRHSIRGRGRSCRHPAWCVRGGDRWHNVQCDHWIRCGRRRAGRSLDTSATAPCSDPLRETQSRQERRHLSNGAMLLSLYVSASSRSVLERYHDHGGSRQAWSCASSTINSPATTTVLTSAASQATKSLANVLRRM
ncbi:unnamed protein product [Urochloa humidicola]